MVISKCTYHGAQAFSGVQQLIIVCLVAMEPTLSEPYVGHWIKVPLHGSADDAH